MQSNELDMRGYFAVLKRRRVAILVTGTVVLSAFLAVAILLPPVYRATATILIERQEIPQDLVRSVITSFADQRIYQISQRVMTSANLTEIIEKYDLYHEDLKEDPLEVVVDAMREDIDLDTVSADVVDPKSGRPSEATIAFMLSYENTEPALAQKVTGELVSLFLQENLKERSETAEQASNFLADEAEKLKRQVLDLETKLAEFKQENVENLPELVQLNWRILDQTENELREIERQLRSQQETIVYADAELSRVSPHLDLISETGQRILSPTDRLSLLETELVSAEAKYGDEHPDVMRLRKEYAALEKQSGGSGRIELAKQLDLKRIELEEMRERYSAEHPDVRKLTEELSVLEQRLADTPRSQSVGAAGREEQPNNPAYIQAQARRRAASGELAALRDRKRELLVKRDSLQAKLLQMPQIERTYRTLTRDYENATAKFREVQAKRLEAEVSESLEIEQKGERFTLIEPPLLPEQPAKPNRPAIAFVGLVFAFLGSMGIAVVSEATDPTVRGRRGITQALQVPPLAAIPVMGSGERENRARNWLVALVLLALLLALAAFLLVQYFDRPLDVLWFSLIRKLGLS